MDVNYSQYGSPPMLVIEECSELIKALCKADRFGWNNTNPKKSKSTTNKQRVEEEIEDVLTRISELKEYLKNV